VQPDGEVKVHAFMVEKAGLSDEEFHRHWRGPHGYLAMRVTEIVRYVQDHTYGSAPRFDGWAPLIYHGLPAVWFENIATATGLHSNPHFQASHADEENLVERDQLGWLRSSETVVVPGPELAPGDPELWKLTLLLQARDAVEDAAFVDLTAQVAGTLPGAVRATASLPRRDQHRESAPLFDAVLEFAFAGRTELEAATDADRFRRDGLPRLERLVDPARSSAAWTYEERWIWP